jgi:hypothetical protein
MPLLVEEAAKLSQSQLERGVIEEIIDREELFAIFPFMTVNGKSYDYNRENTISEGAFLDPYDVVPEGAATFTPVTTRLRIIAGDVDMDKFLLSTQSDHNQQLAEQLSAKSKAVTRQFKNSLINGVGGTNDVNKEFNGVKVLTPASQTLVAGANGGAITLHALDELKDAVTIGADCFMMRQSTWRSVKMLIRAMGGNTSETVMRENFGFPIPAYDGTPIIINDFIGDDEVQGTNNDTTSIYAMKLNTANGFHGIVGGEAAGLKVEEIGTIQNKDAVRYRVKWYVSTALKSTLALARLKGVLSA